MCPVFDDDNDDADDDDENGEDDDAEADDNLARKRGQVGCPVFPHDEVDVIKEDRGGVLLFHTMILMS